MSVSWSERKPDLHRPKSTGGTPPRPGPGASQLLLLQGAAGNRAVQRLVMTDRQWQQESSRAGHMRSEELLGVDSALAAYNRSEAALPAERVGLLGTLRQAIDHWGKSKGDGVDTSIRALAMTKLLRRVNQEHLAISAQAGAVANPDSAAKRQVAAKAHFQHAVALARNAVSLPQVDPDSARLMASATLQPIVAVRKAMRGLATNPPAGTSPADQIAELTVIGLRQAVRILHRLNGETLHAQKDAAQLRSKRLQALDDQIAQLRTLQAPEAEMLEDAKVQVLTMEALVMDRIGAEKEEQQAIHDFAPLEPILDAMDDATTLMGYQGTHGVGNEGMQDVKLTTDKDQEGKPTSSPFLVEGTDARTNDRVSGSADIMNAASGLVGDPLDVYNAIQVLRDPKSTSAQKAQARITILAKAPSSMVGRVLKLTGGALTAHRGAGAGNELAGPAGFTASGTDVSTDVKLGGDFFGLFSGVLGSVQKVIDLVSFVAHGGGDSTKAQDSTARRDLEAVGGGLNKLAGVVASLGGNVKTVTKLALQLKDGGQVGSETTEQLADIAGLKELIPAFGLIKSILGAARDGYRLSRFGIHLGQMRTLVGEAYKAGTASISRVKALELAHDGLVKRVIRGALSLWHSVLGIVSGSLNLAGLGIAPGMVIGIASSAMKIAQVGARKIKFMARDWKAEKRTTETTYAQWELDKTVAAAAKGLPARAKLAFKLLFVPNWDKATARKEVDRHAAALELLEANDPRILEAMGVREELDAAGPDAHTKRVQIVMKALTKRD